MKERMIIVGQVFVNGVTMYCVAAHYSDDIRSSLDKALAATKRKIEGMVRRGVAKYSPAYQYEATLSAIGNPFVFQQKGEIIMGG